MAMARSSAHGPQPRGSPKYKERRGRGERGGERGMRAMSLWFPGGGQSSSAAVLDGKHGRGRGGLRF
eukprot:scaffold158828_cov32-Tisochrysis_lutea.AAC.9